jgi:hypothetical protein
MLLSPVTSTQPNTQPNTQQIGSIRKISLSPPQSPQSPQSPPSPKSSQEGGKQFLQKTRKRSRKLKQALTRYQKKKKTFVKKSPKNRSKKSKPLRYKNKYIK